MGILLLGLCACDRRSERGRAGAGAGVDQAGASPAAAVAASATPSTQPKQPARQGALAAAERLLNAWNAALNAHDPVALEKLYAKDVEFYGRIYSRANVVAAKRKALASSPGFTQQVSDIHYLLGPREGATVEFVKTSGTGKPVRGRLVVLPATGGGFAISTESDDPTDTAAATLAAAREACEGEMHAVAGELPQVKRTFDEAGPDARAGGVTYPTEGKHVSFALGFQHDDRFEAVFFVNWEKSAFSVQQGGEELPVPAAELARVKAVCPR